jgi:parvulin-like peptidyl-prolyl isomerase
MIRLIAATLALLLLPALPLAADPEPAGAAVVPVRVRIIKGSRQGPASLDPKLAPLKQQLSKLAYQRWEQVSERDYQMTVKKTEFTDLPDGQHLALTVEEVGGKTVTIEVALAQRNTQSRLTIEKGQRILHQVTSEKGGVAWFVTVHAWPTGP